ncbi:hypothetical protein [Streptomyces hydrogenans]|uniref:hypothetical protein n=1 Tax=Streptomyces hydrogenans TaxID=1873719 RepID=UPI00343AE517
MAQQRFVRRGITKILWLKSVAAAIKIPTRPSPASTTLRVNTPSARCTVCTRLSVS